MIAGSLIRSAALVPAHPWPRRRLPGELWATMAAALAGTPGLDLLAMWADESEVYALLLDPAVPEALVASVGVVGGAYASLSRARPVAAWFERMIHDLWGHVADGGVDQRPWLDHGVWPMHRPMSGRAAAVSIPPQPPEFLPPEFLPVDGQDIHQLALGPIRAGIIEAGHWRLQCDGETVLRAELRLGYTHKGTLGLLRGKSARAAARFAARLSGDATVAHAIAFARAAEAATQTPAPPRAAVLRAIMAELERLANHCGDVGAICEAAGAVAMAARLGLHREQVLRASAEAFGHRLMMDCVIPGGVVGDIAPGGAVAIGRALDGIDEDIDEIRRFDEPGGPLAGRLVGIGRIDAALAQGLAAGGPVGRASGRGHDCRLVPGYAPYDRFEVEPVLLRAGDVDARVRVRVGELAVAMGLVRRMLPGLPDGAVSVALPPGSGEGLGWAEAFRGDCWCWLRLESGLISSGFLADPSWRHLPAAEQAARDGEVGDFPLIERSVNLSCSGIDL